MCCVLCFFLCDDKARRVASMLSSEHAWRRLAATVFTCVLLCIVRCSQASCNLALCEECWGRGTVARCSSDECVCDCSMAHEAPVDAHATRLREMNVSSSAAIRLLPPTCRYLEGVESTRVEVTLLIDIKEFISTVYTSLLRDKLRLTYSDQVVYESAFARDSKTVAVFGIRDDGTGNVDNVTMNAATHDLRELQTAVANSASWVSTSRIYTVRELTQEVSKVFKPSPMVRIFMEIPVESLIILCAGLLIPFFLCMSELVMGSNFITSDEEAEEQLGKEMAEEKKRRVSSQEGGVNDEAAPAAAMNDYRFPTDAPEVQNPTRSPSQAQIVKNDDMQRRSSVDPPKGEETPHENENSTPLEERKSYNNFALNFYGEASPQQQANDGGLQRQESKKVKKTYYYV